MLEGPSSRYFVSLCRIEVIYLGPMITDYLCDLDEDLCTYAVVSPSLLLDLMLPLKSLPSSIIIHHLLSCGWQDRLSKVVLNCASIPRVLRSPLALLPADGLCASWISFIRVPS